MTYLDRQFFILDTHVKELEVYVGLVEDKTRELNAFVHPDTPNEVAAIMRRLEKIMVRISKLQDDAAL